MSKGGSDRRIFVDTSAYFAATFQHDSNFSIASATLRRLVLERRRLVTTNFVLAELHALIIARGSAPRAFAVVRHIRDSPATTIVRVRARDEARGWEILGDYDDKEYSMTDAFSFAVMERMGLSQAFSFDRHFAQYGWVVQPVAS